MSTVPKRRMFGHKKEGCCPDCGTEVGQPHKGGCDVERCPECGMQRLTCGCITDLPDLLWTGEWPGKAEAAEFGFWCKWGGMPAGWVTCESTDSEAVPNLNRLLKECKWNKETRKWELL